MRFYKLEGLGNDFIFFYNLPFARQNAQTGFLPALAVALCNRRTGIGADGLVLVEPVGDNRFSMEVYNSDGSLALMCGNASRCLGKFVYEHGYTAKTELIMDTASGPRGLTLLPDANGNISAVTVDMGAPELQTERIPALLPASPAISQPLTLPQTGEKFMVTLVNMGNPHCVVFVPDLSAIELNRLGPLFERHPAFPERVNTEFAQVEGPEDIRMAVWERGAGATLACGTGACATLVAAVQNGLVAKQANIHMPGGTLGVRWEGKSVYMTGPAREVFSGDITI